MTDLNPAVETVVNRCVAVREGENVLVVADPDRADVGRALHEGAVRAGGDSVFVLLPPRPERGTEPPPTVAAAFAACDVFLAPCLPSLSHTKARNAATERGARGATLPGVETEMFARLMGADFDTMAARSARVAQLLDEADEARFTCPRGSDMTFDLRGRTGIPDDGDLRESGAFGNLPCGEGFISPAGGSGVLVATTVGHFGHADHEVRLTTEDGRLTAATGALGEALLEHLDRYGADGRHLAELGVGTNERARLGGNLLEDEKVLGTVHVAFGASAAIGGTVNVPVHEDNVVVDPTLTIEST
ncbi:MAG: aminopeptidase, partial [Actinomycetota bacterium]|nr:aminopeptidase [Actinomycetota bacterium]